MPSLPASGMSEFLLFSLIIIAATADRRSKDRLELRDRDKNRWWEKRIAFQINVRPRVQAELEGLQNSSCRMPASMGN